ncbi:unnamed protein product [Symbiodinium pilosum]|uniref:Uncharacterized protein n=1 Tax=Symbiodinium pilosum TaxID=2952 RepID=A0A812IY17_SYMPI|nr:unnamed protein product [Symbiodinium pilosum]
MPERVRAGLWNRSKQLDHFDVFLSHTWLTKGRSKFLSLALQCGWRHIVLSWFLAVLFVESLVLMDLLPSHTQLKATGTSASLREMSRGAFFGIEDDV